VEQFTTINFLFMQTVQIKTLKDTQEISLDDLKLYLESKGIKSFSLEAYDQPEILEQENEPTQQPIKIIRKLHYDRNSSKRHTLPRVKNPSRKSQNPN
jgi:hypothetical protein